MTGWSTRLSVLQIRRPFGVGDQVGLGEFEGTVRDVNLQTVELSGYDGVTVYLPNSQVTGGPIINYTRTPLSRPSLRVGVAYDADLERTRELLLQACGSASAGQVADRVAVGSRRRRPSKSGSKSSGSLPSLSLSGTGTPPTSPVDGASATPWRSPQNLAWTGPASHPVPAADTMVRPQQRAHGPRSRCRGGRDDLSRVGASPAASPGWHSVSCRCRLGRRCD